MIRGIAKLWWKPMVGDESSQFGSVILYFFLYLFCFARDG